MTKILIAFTFLAGCAADNIDFTGPVTVDGDAPSANADGGADGSRLTDATSTGKPDGGQVDMGGPQADSGPDGGGIVQAPDMTPPVTCFDGVKDGNESDIDCGGSCPRCADGKACTTGPDCAGGACLNNVCGEHCADGVKDVDESDVDCGGSCKPCDVGQSCGGAMDCKSQICGAFAQTCSAPTCDDGRKNGAETDVDCGGGTCGKCSIGQACVVEADCKSAMCVNSVCIDHCKDGIKNADETDVDCGGSTCGACADLKACAADGDCKSGKCTNAVCMPAHCFDGIKDGNESDIDCGGGEFNSGCLPCQVGQACHWDEDCLHAPGMVGGNNYCTSNRCCDGKLVLCD